MRRYLRSCRRAFSRSPVLASVGLLTVAVGIGANTAVYTLFDAAFLRSLPGEQPDRLVSIFESDPKNAGAAGYFSDYFPVSFPNYRDVRESQDAFTDVAAYSWMRTNVSGGDGPPEEIYGELVSGNYFEVFGIAAAAGRTLVPEDDEVEGARPVVVISHGLWTRRFGADPGAIGRILSMNGQPMEIVGVAEEGFRGPNRLFPHDYWIPIAMHAQVYSRTAWLEQRSAPLFKLVGRLAPGVEIEAATAAFANVAENLEREYPDVNQDLGFRLVPLESALIDPNQRGALMRIGYLLLGGVVGVLLVTCATLSILFLALATGRRSELALRLTLGASRWRIFGQLLGESVVFSLVGGLLGLGLGVLGARLLWGLRPPVYSATALDLGLDPGVLAVTATVTVLTGVLFGLAPARCVFDPALASSLEGSGRGGREKRSTFGFRRLLVAGQVALSVVLLVLASLCLYGMVNARRAGPGYDPESLFVVTLDLGAQGYSTGEAKGRFRQIVDAVGAVPGTRGVALGRNYPLDPGGGINRVSPEGAEAPVDAEGIYVREDLVSADYLEVLGIPVLRGRGFDPALDDADSRPVAVVNEAMAARFWPGRHAVGRSFRTAGGEHPVTVVGVVADGRYVSLDEASQPYYFLPLEQAPGNRLTLWVRNGSPDAPDRVREAIRALEPEVPLVKARRVAEVVEDVLWKERLTTALLIAFGTLAAVLATAGIYGTLAYSLGRRRREIGLRLALGATRRDVVWMIVGEGLGIVGLGLIVGLVAAWLSGHVLSSLLHGIDPFRPLALVVVAALLVATTLFACLTVGWRSLRVEARAAMEV